MYRDTFQGRTDSPLLTTDSERKTPASCAVVISVGLSAVTSAVVIGHVVTSGFVYWEIGVGAATLLDDISIEALQCSNIGLLH